MSTVANEHAAPKTPPPSAPAQEDPYYPATSFADVGFTALPAELLSLSSSAPPSFSSASSPPSIAARDDCVLPCFEPPPPFRQPPKLNLIARQSHREAKVRRPYPLSLSLVLLSFFFHYIPLSFFPRTPRMFESSLANRSRPFAIGER
jgi:hypothetical protein